MRTLAVVGGGTGAAGSGSAAGAITGAAIFGFAGLRAALPEAHASVAAAITKHVIESAHRCPLATRSTTAQRLPEPRTQGKRHAQREEKNPINSIFQLAGRPCLDDRTTGE